MSEFMSAFRWWVAVSCLVAVGCSSKDATTGTAGGEETGPVIEVQPDGGEWKSFRNPEGRYSVLLPGEAIAIPLEEKDTVSHGVELEQGGGYTVMYSTVEEVAPEAIEAGLAKIQAAVVENRKLLHEEKLMVGKHPARDFAFIEADGDAHYYRLIIVGRRLYQVMTVTEEAKFEAVKADRQKFLDSFELLE
jgi:hypothetical protein